MPEVRKRKDLAKPSDRHAALKVSLSKYFVLNGNELADTRQCVAIWVVIVRGHHRPERGVDQARDVPAAVVERDVRSCSAARYRLRRS